jgi:Tfp pilus assembly protein PilF
MSPLCRILVVASAVIAISACSTDDNASGSATSNLDSALMAKGTDLMYQKGDPIAAEQVFRQVLEHNPNHYGAHYQLAVAVDRAGRPTEARPMWQDVLKRAQAVNDSETIRAAVPRLAAPDTVGSNQLMIIGLNLLYAQNNPSVAAEQFKKVLALKPQHYGATYQLAKSLDLAGKHAEAKPIWARMVTMAEAVNDKTTADTARARLKQDR